MQRSLDVLFAEYRPNQVVAVEQGGGEGVIPLLEGREAMDGKATAYVCEHFACQMPVTDAEALYTQLKE